jgi:hypothetical protein
MPKIKSTVLDDLRVTYNDAKLLETHTAYEFLPIVLDVAALEYIEGHAKPLLSTPDHAGRMLLEVDLQAVPEHSWRIWLEECSPEYILPEITWPLDSNLDAGPVHAALSAQVVRAVKAIRARERFLNRGNIKMSASIANLGSHKRLDLITRRATLVADADRAPLTQEASLR